jgi:hypothetical protein
VLGPEMKRRRKERTNHRVTEGTEKSTEDKDKNRVKTKER